MTESVLPEETRFEARLSAMVEEALELRHGAADDPEGPLGTVDFDSGPGPVYAMLIRVRHRSDRVDYLFAQATRIKAAAHRSRDNARFEADNAYHSATNTNERNRTREFVTKEERNAEAFLASLAEKREAFLKDRLVSHADEAYDVINQISRQLANIRYDLRASLTALQFESSLER